MKLNHPIPRYECWLWIQGRPEFRIVIPFWSDWRQLVAPEDLPFLNRRIVFW